MESVEWVMLSAAFQGFWQPSETRDTATVNSLQNAQLPTEERFKAIGTESTGTIHAMSPF